MINGYVNPNLQAVIPIDIFDHRNRLRRIDAIVDTGFDDSLALPLSLIRNLGLPWAGQVFMRVATGELEDFNTYAATVSWFGRRRTVRVLETQNEILAGTGLLQGSELTIQLWHGGAVTVSPPTP